MQDVNPRRWFPGTEVCETEGEPGTARRLWEACAEGEGALNQLFIYPGNLFIGGAVRAPDLDLHNSSLATRSGVKFRSLVCASAVVMVSTCCSVGLGGLTNPILAS